MIVVADSCACGIVALRAVHRAAPGICIRYYADYANNPLGRKSDAAIVGIVQDWDAMAQGISAAELLVIACNTASVALHFHSGSATGSCHSVTMVDAFNAMVDSARGEIEGARILILGTTATARSGAYAAILEAAGAAHASAFAATEAERIVASGLYRSEEGREVAAREIEPVASQPWDIVVLGCTCFGFLRYLYRDMFRPDVRFLDPLDFLAEPLSCRLAQPGEVRGDLRVELVTSGTPAQLELVRRFAEDLFPDMCFDDRQIDFKHTVSGSTGKPLRMIEGRSRAAADIGEIVRQ